MKLTLSALAYRALWEADRRSGFKALRTPRGQVPIPASVPAFDEWWDELGSAHRLGRLAAGAPGGGEGPLAGSNHRLGRLAAGAPGGGEGPLAGSNHRLGRLAAGAPGGGEGPLAGSNHRLGRLAAGAPGGGEGPLAGSNHRLGRLAAGAPGGGEGPLAGSNHRLGRLAAGAPGGGEGPLAGSNHRLGRLAAGAPGGGEGPLAGSNHRLGRLAAGAPGGGEGRLAAGAPGREEGRLAGSAPGGGERRLPAGTQWHLEPNTGQHWPGRVHWTKALDAGVGDVRLTWERNRFGHVWEWIAGGEQAAEAFEAEVRDWRHENPFRSGVNWASGQELAVRSLAWLAGGAAYGGEMSQAGWQDLVELLYWHAVHIESEFGFARRVVRNNHVIAEGLGLAAIADAFPGFDEAERWRSMGLAAIETAVEEQFFADGGYCQHSHAYHAFALELLLEAWLWFEELRPVLQPVFARSARYFEALIEPGGLPNFGPNDRAAVPDYAGLLELLLERAQLEPLSAPLVRSFPDAGLHVLRDDEVTVTLRCGELPDRAGHDDGLHLEIWRGGQPVTLDAGSYRYGGPEHAYFAGARSHNVCLVGNEEPRELLSTFTWDRCIRPQLEELDAVRGLIVARYDDAFPGVRWERRVRLRDGVVVVEDLLNTTPSRLAVFRLRWMLAAQQPDLSVDEQQCFTWNITSERSKISMRVEPLLGGLNGPTFEVCPMWTSSRYGQRDMSVALLLRAAAKGVRFVTTFSPP